MYFSPEFFARNERIIFVEYIYIYKSVVPRFIGVRGSEKRGGRREEKSDRKRGCPWGLCYSVRFVGNRKTKSGSKIHEKKGGRKKKKRTFVEDRKNGRKLYRVVSFFFFPRLDRDSSKIKIINWRYERRSDDQISIKIIDNWKKKRWSNFEIYSGDFGKSKRSEGSHRPPGRDEISLSLVEE